MINENDNLAVHTALTQDVSSMIAGCVHGGVCVAPDRF